MSFIVYGTVNFKILYVKNASVLFTHEITLYSVEIMCLHVIAVNLKFNFH